MFKRTDKMITDNDYHIPAKRARFDTPQYHRVQKLEVPRRNVQYDDLWGDDFAEEEIVEMDLVASQACLQEGNVLDNSKLCENSLNPVGCDLELPVVTRATCSKTLQLQSAMPAIGFDFWMKENVQSTSRVSQDITDINYSQFKHKLIDRKDHNSTFQKGINFIIPDDKELKKVKSENKKLLDDFITKDGETIFLRQQLQQIQLRAENERLEKMRLIEEQANRHRSEINKICKEKEQLKTQLELQHLEIENLLERCKLLESGNIKLKKPQVLHMNNSLNKSKCSIPTNRPTNGSKNSSKGKEVYVQTNTFKKSNYQFKTCNTHFSLARISELMFEPSVPEKPIINIQVVEKTGRRNLPIMQEEETFRIFENPNLVKPVITIVDGKKLTTEFILFEIIAIERKINAEIESSSCIPIINKLVLTARELILNIITVLRTIFQAMRNDDIRDMNDLYFSTVYKSHSICTKSECEANAWHEGEHGIEARRLLGALAHISSESSYLSNYLSGKSPLLTRNDENYNRYLQQMMRYNAWSKKGHEFEMLEMILECITLIGRVRRSHQFTGLINAIVKVLCNVRDKVDYCEKGLEYVCLIFKELVFSRPLSLCYVSMANFVMVFSRYSTFVQKLCRNSQSMAIKNWKGALHFTPDTCVLQILIAQIQYFRPDFLTTVNMTHALISSVRCILQTNNNLLKTESSESCNCYKKLLQLTINILGKCSETRIDIIDNTEWRHPIYATNKCYTLKRINYKDYAYQTRYTQTTEKQTEVYPENLDRNFWSNTKKIQHKVLREGIRFLCHLAICDPDFIIRSPDVENSFHLFIRNITLFNDLILHENEQEALDRIKTTFIIDKNMQNEIEIHNKNIPVNQSSIANFKKKVILTMNDHTGSAENIKRIHMAIKALYSSKTEYRDN